MRARLVLLTLLLALFAAWSAPTALAADTAAVAVNTRDGASVFRLAFQIKRVAGDVVDNANAAVSFASCTDCQTVAISIQVVLVTGDPEVVTTENFAIAINENCTFCDTLASAYQWVLSTGGQMRFTPEGSQAIAEIRRELHALRGSGLSGPEIQARLNELMTRLATVLRNELVAAGSSVDAGPPDQPTTTAPTSTAPAETETTPTPTTTETTPTETGTETTTTP
jgi:putative peptide zinc metalloprotease protein